MAGENILKIKLLSCYGLVYVLLMKQNSWGLKELIPAVGGQVLLEEV